MVKEAVNDGGFYLAVDAAQKAEFALEQRRSLYWHLHQKELRDPS
jgi:hypothetical protein